MSRVLPPARRALALPLAFVASLALTLACHGYGNEADELGVGAECSATGDCLEGQSCLTQFKGGYCGMTGCTSSDDCPASSGCVTHTDSQNYCFRICADKDECNANRSVEVESNCSSNVTFASGKKEGKACVPPSN